jgi:hypothetical protein
MALIPLGQRFVNPLTRNICILNIARSCVTKSTEMILAELEKNGNEAAHLTNGVWLICPPSNKVARSFTMEGNGFESDVIGRFRKGFGKFVRRSGDVLLFENFVYNCADKIIYRLPTYERTSGIRRLPLVYEYNSRGKYIAAISTKHVNIINIENLTMHVQVLARSRYKKMHFSMVAGKPTAVLIRDTGDDDKGSVVFEAYLISDNFYAFVEFTRLYREIKDDHLVASSSGEKNCVDLKPLLIYYV